MELLIVIAIVVILAGLLLPALSRSKARAQAIMCINNSRNLALTWTMYSMDNSDKLAYNQASSAQLRLSVSPSTPNWMNNTMDWELSSGNTNLNFLDQSVMATSARDAAQIYRCPSDRVLSSVQRAAGWTQRVRSISMNAMVGDPGASLNGDQNMNNPGYMQFMKGSDFKDPSFIFVFLDEHPDSISDGNFLNKPASNTWFRLPGSYHNGGGSFSFADGHTEIHRWQCASTCPPNIPGGANLPISLSLADTTDFDWVNRHASFPAP